MSEILTQENAIILAAARKMVSLGAAASQKVVNGYESKRLEEERKGSVILQLLTAYRKKTALSAAQLEAILYDLRNLSEESAFPTVSPIVGQELNYIISNTVSGTELPDNIVIDCGGHSASFDLFPTTGGTGPSGSIKRGNQFDITVAGTLGGVDVEPGVTIRAKVDDPGQDLNNWRIYY